MARYVPRDAAYRRAQKSGYRSRAALKLAELDGRFHFLRQGARVLDLGCWPGGWLQVAAATVGPSGLVVGVDVKEVTDLRLGNVRTLAGDVSHEDTLGRLQEALGAPADVVLSDLAPKMSGVRDVDRARQLSLCEATLACCRRLLRPGGCCVIKLFSDSEQDATRLLSRSFAQVAAHRPASTRRGSSEIYAVCTKFLVRPE